MQIALIFFFLVSDTRTPNEPSFDLFILAKNSSIKQCNRDESANG